MISSLMLIMVSFGSYSQDILLGADLSYANEMNDCGAVFYDDGQEKDVFSIFADHQNNVVRLRLWHTPDSTNYSTFQDVKRSIQRAKNESMQVLLDFHYSDTWADPAKQTRPKAWTGITDLQILSDSVYNYTFKVLSDLAAENLLPEFVQIGNETNGNIMVEEGDPLYPIDWQRNVQLFEAGIQATNDVDSNIQTVLHIADPTNAEWWFATAAENQLIDFDIIGLSYYPQWHHLGIAETGNVVQALKQTHNKPVWIVETGYPWTLDNNGDAGNILGEASILPGYANPPTINSQKNFLINLTYEVIKNEGFGVIYWEPAWVTTSCSTLWGLGSHYENATFFDFDNQLHEGIDFLSYDYSQPPSTTAEVSFYVDMTGIDTSDGVFVTGDFTGEAWQFMPMNNIGNNLYKYTTTMSKGSEGAYIFTKKADWDLSLYHEQVPEACAPFWGTHRGYSITEDAEIYAFAWSSCDALPLNVEQNSSSNWLLAYPNPFTDSLILSSTNPDFYRFRVVSADGKTVAQWNTVPEKLNTINWQSGLYVVQLLNQHGVVIESFQVLKTR